MLKYSITRRSSVPGRRHCNRTASVPMNRVAVTLDEAERAWLLHQAETLMAQDIPSVPVYARPGFVIRKATVEGPLVNPTNEGAPWNISAWTA